jgi:ATP-dependent RNA helicase RhlE
MQILKDHGKISRPQEHYRVIMSLGRVGVASGINHHHAQHACVFSGIDNNTNSVEQTVYYVASDRKQALLAHLIRHHDINNAIVFARTTGGAERLARQLTKSGITAQSYHRGQPIHVREQTLTDFRNKRFGILVSTDTAASTIEIPAFDFVINFELPASAETYMGRIARTSSGKALSLCDDEDKRHIKNINRVLSSKLQAINHPFA